MFYQMVLHLPYDELKNTLILFLGYFHPQFLIVIEILKTQVSKYFMKFFFFYFCVDHDFGAVMQFIIMSKLRIIKCNCHTSHSE